VPPLRRTALRAFLASLCVATLVVGPVLFARASDRIQPASTSGAAGGIPAAPLLALAILGAMSGLVLLVALRPTR
jgi:hypothetical protein